MQSALKAPVSRRTGFLCHASAWYGLLFATPLLVAILNRQDLVIQPAVTGLFLFLSCVAITFVSWRLGRAMPVNAERWLSGLMLAVAVMLAIQGNLLHPLTYFGQFDGSIVDFRKYGIYFWLEWYGFLAGLVLLTLWFGSVKRLPGWLPWLPILSFSLMLFSALVPAVPPSGHDAESDYDRSVFEFSRNRNLIHLLPDGLQGDIVEQVFKDNPGLAARFNGFTLFSDHLGAYHGTAPAIPAMLTGRPFEFHRGHTYQWITPYINEHSYQNQLVERGFTADLVTIDSAYCLSRADSCVSRPFSDWKSRGYERQMPGSSLYSFRLMVDLTLYRLTPSFLKEKIHNRGDWMLADSSLDGASPWPDPVIREWTENMQVTDGPGAYKFYHYIGTHKPPFWDASCTRHASLPRTREFFLGQAHCLLEGLAGLLDKLRNEGIYDQTAIIISGDHGHDIAPRDLPEPPATVVLDEHMMGTARPALLVKRMNDRNPLQLSNAQTGLLDIPDIALALIAPEDIPAGSFQPLANDNQRRTRRFYHYSVDKIRRLDSQPVPYDTYQVSGAVSDQDSWVLTDMYSDIPAPEQYPVISYDSAAEFLRGARLNPATPSKELAWLDRKQLGFLVGINDGETAERRLVLTLHIPEWIGEQSFAVKVNQALIEGRYHASTTDRFWQEVVIDLPGGMLRTGNNFIHLSFNALHTSPSNPRLKAAALLKSIQVKNQNRTR